MLLAQVQDSPQLQGQRILRINLERARNVLSSFGVAPAVERFACLVEGSLGLTWRLQLICRHHSRVLQLCSGSALRQRPGVVHLCVSNENRGSDDRSQKKALGNCLPSPLEADDDPWNKNSHTSSPAAGIGANVALTSRTLTQF